MPISKKQKTAIAAIILVGVLAGAGLTLTGNQRSGKEDAHGHAGHSEASAHNDSEQPEHAAGEKEHTEHAAGEKEHTDDAAHADKEHHEENAKIALTPEQIKAAGLVVQAAAPATLQSSVQFPGEIKFNDDRTAHVVPRLAGVAEAVPVTIGQSVKKGQVLAVIASTALSDQRSELLAARKRLELAQSTYAREKTLWEDKISAEQDFLQARTSLQEAQIAVRNASQKLTAIGASDRSDGLNRFELRAPFDGVIVEKHLALGEAVKEDASIFTISDLSTVWAEFVIAPKDLGRIRAGKPVTISTTAFDGKAEGKVSYVGALLGQQTRTATARVTLKNPDTAWRPGLFVTVSLIAEEEKVPVAVTADAIQTVDNKKIVFVAAPGGFVAQAVETGRSGNNLVEITSGLKAGAQYVSANSFILKSELGKASAEHAH